MDWLVIKIQNRNAEKTVLVFSGLAPRNHMFEWFGSFQNLECNIIGIRDDFNCWYQRDKKETKDDLNEILNDTKRENLICVGGSAGGFAALWFGKQLNAGKILAFCPQSACGEAKRNLNDLRWPEFCKTTDSEDLKDIEFKNSIVFYANDDSLDVMHAERLNVAEHLKFHSGGHDLPKKLKECNELNKIFAGELQ
jgi:hypothetical protein